MPTIAEASEVVTNFPNKFVSPYGNDEIVPLYSSVPLKSPVQGCLECIVCGSSLVRSQVIADVSNSRFGSGGVGADKVSITPYLPPKFYGPGGSYAKSPQNPSAYYRYLIRTDWGQCLMSRNAPVIDSFTADGVAYHSYPWPFVPGPGGKRNRPALVVDGYTVWERNLDKTTATCVAATGNYVSAANNHWGLNFVGTIWPLTNLNYGTGCVTGTVTPCCPVAPSVPYSYLNQPGTILCNQFIP